MEELQAIVDLISSNLFYIVVLNMAGSYGKIVERINVNSKSGMD